MLNEGRCLLRLSTYLDVPCSPETCNVRRPRFLFHLQRRNPKTGMIKQMNGARTAGIIVAAIMLLRVLSDGAEPVSRALDALVFGTELFLVDDWVAMCANDDTDKSVLYSPPDAFEEGYSKMDDVRASVRVCAVEVGDTEFEAIELEAGAV